MSEFVNKPAPDERQSAARFDLVPQLVNIVQGLVNIVQDLAIRKVYTQSAVIHIVSLRYLFCAGEYNEYVK
jgi:hypothetical protein